MWNSVLDRAKEAAARAAEAAEQIENQLNDSVGVQQQQQPPQQSSASLQLPSVPPAIGAGADISTKEDGGRTTATDGAAAVGWPSLKKMANGATSSVATFGQVSVTAVAPPAYDAAADTAAAAAAEIDDGWDDDDTDAFYAQDDNDADRGDGYNDDDHVDDRDHEQGQQQEAEEELDFCAGTSAEALPGPRAADADGLNPASTAPLFPPTPVSSSVGDTYNNKDKGRATTATSSTSNDETNENQHDEENACIIQVDDKAAENKDDSKMRQTLDDDNENTSNIPDKNDGADTDEDAFAGASANEEGWDEEDVADALVDDVALTEGEKDDVAESDFGSNESGELILVPVNNGDVDMDKENDECSSIAALSAANGQRMTNNETLKIEEVVPSSQGGENAERGESSTDAPAVSALQIQIKELSLVIAQREEQLTSKAQQMTSMQDIFDKERDELRAKLLETKEEAKSRIGKAKERVNAIEGQLLAANHRLQAAGTDDSQKDEMIAALREEGESLMRKQSQMEQSVRSVRSEMRNLKEEVAEERAAKETAQTKISDLETKLKVTTDELAGARKGETRAGKLDQEMILLREESEKKAATILSLEQQLKELKEENKILKRDAENAKKDAMLEMERESSDLKRERDDMLADLETKLRTSEREAAVREDALRHEVDELRKRWQDAVRRADAMNIDMQQTSAPLMRQLESTERQHRVRAAAWSELEMKLRSELEDGVLQNEKLAKERNDLKASLKRTERACAEKELEFTDITNRIEDTYAALQQANESIEQLREENSELKQQCEESEAEAAAAINQVRSEMTEAVMMSEDRHHSHVASMERDLLSERDKRTALETQLKNLAERTEKMALGHGERSETSNLNSPKDVKKKLRASTGQIDILQSALANFESSDDEEESKEDSDDIENENDVDDDMAFSKNQASNHSGNSSFAAMEQLSQGLKGARLELQALRKQLAASEETRKSLVGELAEARSAIEKLPLFESKIAELTHEIREKELELQCLKDDIIEVRLMYRSQLDELLEEKASSHTSIVNTIETGDQDDALEHVSEDDANDELLVPDITAEMMT